ncbi:MAG: hypothetical protein DRJ03_02785 [Chloroflexi bacterium]|nr:MAG: hypothetical protein DRJ03_02785 [Chloroflexota bacterium]
MITLIMSNYKQKTKSDLLKFCIKAKYPTTNVVVLLYSTTDRTRCYLKMGNVFQKTLDSNRATVIWWGMAKSETITKNLLKKKSRN